MTLTVAVDWDGTLVDPDGEWLPGAVTALRWLHRNRAKVVIHSARASYPQGLAAITDKLATICYQATIAAKPAADIYIDDKAITFTGWPAAIKTVRGAKRGKT